jgi:hypothetical protein
MGLKLPKAPRFLKKPKLPQLKKPKLPQIKAPKMPSLSMGTGMSTFFNEKGAYLMGGLIGYLPAIALAIYIIANAKSTASKYISIFVIILGIIGIWAGLGAPIQVNVGIFTIVYIQIIIAFIINSPPSPPKEENKEEKKE